MYTDGIERAWASPYCPTFRGSNMLPGQVCNKSNCRRFPCVCVGTEKEMTVRRAFDSDPEVGDWRTEVSGGDIWEHSDQQ